MNRKNATLIGASFGIATFLAVAMLPAMLYGGYAGVLLASGIFGAPLQPSFIVRTLIIGGMILGTVGVGALFTVAGAAIGGGVSVLTEFPAFIASKARE